MQDQDAKVWRRLWKEVQGHTSIKALLRDRPRNEEALPGGLERPVQGSNKFEGVIGEDLALGLLSLLGENLNAWDGHVCKCESFEWLGRRDCQEPALERLEYLYFATAFRRRHLETKTDSERHAQREFTCR